MRHAWAAALVALLSARGARADGEITRSPSAAELSWYQGVAAAVQRAWPAQVGKLLAEPRKVPPAPAEVNASGKVPLRYQAEAAWKEPRQERDPRAAPPDADALARSQEAHMARMQEAMARNDHKAVSEIMARMAAEAEATGIVPREPRKLALEIRVNPGTVELWKGKPWKGGPAGALGYQLEKGPQGPETVVLLGAWNVKQGADPGTVLPTYDRAAPGMRVQAIAVRARGVPELAEPALAQVRWAELGTLLGR